MSQGALNAETLRTLLEYADPGQPDFLREIFSCYLSDTEIRLAAMREARNTGDTAILARAAHTIEGSSLNVGADMLAGLMQSLQRDAKLGILPEAERLRACEAEFERVRQALSHFLA
jgi:HPt (histidine-containing phosphotransfer) domain-containing protein